MRKQVLILIVAIFLTLSGCLKNTNNNTTTGTISSSSNANELAIVCETRNGSDTFYLDLTMDDVKEGLQKLGITWDEYEDTNEVNSGDWGTKMLMTDSISFYFNIDQELRTIEVKGNSRSEITIKTQSGLVVGDPKEEILSLYGDNYKEYNNETDHSIIYEYFIGSQYLQVFLEDDAVIGLKVTKNSFKTSDENAVEEHNDSTLKPEDSVAVISPDYSGTWYSKDFELHYVEEYKTIIHSGTIMTLALSDDGTGGKITLECTSDPPMSRIAIVEADLVIINDHTATFSFDDDGWGSRGSGTVSFEDDRIIVTTEGHNPESSNWYIYLGETIFLKDAPLKTVDESESDGKWSAEHIRDYILKAKSLFDNFAQDCEVTSNIIGSLDSCDIYECTGKYSLELLLKRAGAYYTVDLIETELRQRYLCIVDGKIGRLGATGENRYVILEESIINLKVDDDLKKVAEIEAFNDAGESTILTYTLERFNDRWLITDIKGFGYSN